jgi:hypothetical protein
MTGTAIDIDSALSQTPRSDHIEPVLAVMAGLVSRPSTCRLLNTRKEDPDVRYQRGQDGQNLFHLARTTL